MNEPPKTPIGSVRMAKDGSLLIFLRTTTESGVVGHGYAVIGVHDPNHRLILGQVGKLEPEQEAPLYPWPKA